MSSDTRQEAFDVMVSGLIKQGKPSYDIQTMGCMYDNGAGQKCAVGMLIPDEVYSPTLEGCGVLSLAYKAGKGNWKTKHLLNKMNHDTLFAVQKTHDMSVTFYREEGTEKWIDHIKKEYKALAFKLGLEWSHG
jgi:hypothetical protein